jgi:hypothetical protein
LLPLPSVLHKVLRDRILTIRLRDMAEYHRDRRREVVTMCLRDRRRKRVMIMYRLDKLRSIATTITFRVTIVDGFTAITGMTLIVGGATSALCL